MLSIAAMSGSQGVYYTGLAREDYYLDGGEPPGVWFGQGAQDLGLSGLVDRELFTPLFDGFDPKGNPMVQNAGDPARRAGWDLTFSAPKSVSVLWSLLPKELGAEIRAAHDAAVKAACAYLEDQAGLTRRGKDGNIIEKTGMVIGLFEHGTSRAGDPQLHTHALVMNLALREDGTTGGLHSRSIYQHKMAAGALYRAELAAQLRERLSLTVERVGNWFEVKGVSAKLIAHWSKRRKEIESALEESGYSSAKAAEVAALNTRHTKEHVARHKLFPQWQKDGEEIGWGQAQAEALCHSGATLSRDRPEVAQALAVKEAVAQITREQAYFSEKDLVRRMAEHAVELGLGAKEVLGAAREFLSDRAISLGLRGGLGLFTTPEMLELEKQLLEQAGNLHRNHDHQVSEQVMESVMQKYAHLNPEQREAVAHITVKPEGLALVAGMAGTGKTTMLKAAAEVWEKQGFKVQGAALAGKAAEGLAEEAGIATMTIHKSLFLAENSHGLFSDFKNPLTKNTVLVVDEAGMVGTHLMSRLLNEAEQAGAKVVLVGDARQLQPIEAGGPFASMAEKFGQATLRTIIRQKDQWAREAVHDMADGNAGRALAAFADRGLLTVADTKTQARSELLGCWRKDGVVKPDENLILAGTKKDTALLNKEAQAMRKEERQLGLLSLKAGGDSFHKGDRILFTKNSGPMGVKNGQLGTVTHVDCIASTLYVKLDNKRKVEIPVRQYDHVQLGYAVTTHKSQGMTAQNAFIMTHPSMQDKELSYVQASRARDTTRIFTTKAEAGQELSQLAATMSQSRQKELAADVLTPKQDMEAVNKVRAAIKEHKQRQTLTQELRYHMGLTP